MLSDGLKYSLFGGRLIAQDRLTNSSYRFTNEYSCIFLGRWVTKVTRYCSAYVCYSSSLSSNRIETSLKTIQNWRQKQKSDQHTLASQKIFKKEYSRRQFPRLAEDYWEYYPENLLVNIHPRIGWRHFQDYLQKIGCEIMSQNYCPGNRGWNYSFTIHLWYTVSGLTEARQRR